MPGGFNFIGDGNGQVCRCNICRLVAPACQQLISAHPLVAGALAGCQSNRWRDKAPAQRGFGSEFIQDLARGQCALLVRSRKLWRINQLQTGRHKQVEGQTTRVVGRVKASQIAVIHALCLPGWGISQGVSEEDCKALADRRLLPVLPRWHLADTPVYAVSLRRGQQPAKVRHALDMLTGWFGAGAAAAEAAIQTNGVDDPLRLSP